MLEFYKKKNFPEISRKFPGKNHGNFPENTGEKVQEKIKQNTPGSGEYLFDYKLESLLQEKDKKMGDILNIRTLAMAEDMGLSLLVICSTCQGVISQANHRVRNDSKYLDEINEVLSDEGLKYNGTTKVKHLLWAIIEDIGLEELKKTFVSELKGLELAPFYGCYMVRPSDALEFNKYPERENSLELLIESTGAAVTKYSGTTACCGFPILFINQENSLKMVSKHTGSAKDSGANAIVAADVTASSWR